LGVQIGREGEGKREEEIEEKRNEGKRQKKNEENEGVGKKVPRVVREGSRWLGGK
jgi:hypothetical protein